MTALKAIFIGECMVELSSAGNGMLKKSFAGDVFNSSVYMKRLVKDKCDVSVMTVIGEDKVSMDMERFFATQGLGNDTVFKSSEGTVGLYMIDTDDQGERSFSYWRDNSVARRLITILDDKNVAVKDFDADLIFFTGITLAIMDIENREKLLKQISSARSKGARVAFDPNYRELLWENKSEAKGWIKKAYDISDIVFPSLEEEKLIFGIKSIDESLEKFRHDCEVVLKAGGDGMFVSINGNRTHKKFVPADNVVDTTAAGDSFDGSYLAMRIMGKDIEMSLNKAAEVAAKVVTFPGAIMPGDLTL